MGIIDHLVLRGSSSRAVVLGVLGGGVALTGLVVYVRNVEANPVRLGRDNNGVLRWMTRLEQYEARLDAAKLRQRADNSKEAQLAVEIWEGAIQKERARLERAGALPVPVDDSDLRL